MKSFWRLVQIIMAMYVSCGLPLFILKRSLEAWDLTIVGIPLLGIFAPGLWLTMLATLVLCSTYIINPTCPAWVLFLCGLSYGSICSAVYFSFRAPSHGGVIIVPWVSFVTAAVIIAEWWILFSR